MSSKYSVAEARAQLPKILDEVGLGKEIELTRRGKPVAVLVSVDEYRRLAGEGRSFAEAYGAFRARHGGLKRDDLKNLRDISPGRSVKS